MGSDFYPCLALALFSGEEKVNLTQGCEEITQNFPQVTNAVAELGGGSHFWKHCFTWKSKRSELTIYLNV